MKKVYTCNAIIFQIPNKKINLGNDQLPLK